MGRFVPSSSSSKELSLNRNDQKYKDVWAGVLVGGDSCSEDHGFKSLHHILDGNFHIFCCKNCIDVCLKRPK